MDFKSYKTILDEKDQIILNLSNKIKEKDETIDDLKILISKLSEVSKNKQTPPQSSNGQTSFSGGGFFSSPPSNEITYKFTNHARLKCSGVKTVTPKHV